MITSRIQVTIAAAVIMLSAGVVCAIRSAAQVGRKPRQAAPSGQVSIQPEVLSDSPSPPWFQTIEPIRSYYVSPSGSGSGSTSSPMGLAQAIAQAQPGDEYLLTDGEYVNPPNIAAGGTTDHPVVFRARPGDHVIIEGRFEIDAASVWIWGFEITDPGNIGPRDSGVSLLGSGDRVINCVIHDINGNVGNGVGAWDEGPGQVVYGNAIFHNGNGWMLPQPGPPHGIYAQNTYSTGGYKYFIANFLGDPLQNCPPGCYNLHAYGSSGRTQGMYLARNVFLNGNVLLGGSGTPASDEVVLQNVFYNSTLQLGYHQVSQSTVQNNVIVQGTLNSPTFWGSGESVYPRTSYNIWTGNQIYSPQPGDPHISIHTAVNTASGYCEKGCAGIDAHDVIDNNRYSAPFAGSLNAKGANGTNILDLDAWRAQSAAGGGQFDGNSAVVSLPTGVTAYLFPNLYDPSRAFLAVLNWSQADRVSIEIGAPFASTDRIRLVSAEHPFDPPVSSAISGGALTWNTNRASFGAFLVIGSPAAHYHSPPTPLAARNDRRHTLLPDLLVGLD